MPLAIVGAARFPESCQAWNEKMGKVCGQIADGGLVIPLYEGTEGSITQRVPLCHAHKPTSLVGLNMTIKRT